MWHRRRSMYVSKVTKSELTTKNVTKEKRDLIFFGVKAAWRSELKITRMKCEWDCFQVVDQSALINSPIEIDAGMWRTNSNGKAFVERHLIRLIEKWKQSGGRKWIRSFEIPNKGDEDVKSEKEWMKIASGWSAVKLRAKVNSLQKPKYNSRTNNLWLWTPT